PTPTPITPLAQITDWLGVREQIKQDLARITGDAWAVYAGTVQDHTHKLLEENEALHAWLAAQGEN
ncbi:MAG TPA: hypothetical protein DCR93_30675, partial [Cytophagales bacterium]|nr:hypothetical protein [Cytophagales bacterium]